MARCFDLADVEEQRLDGSLDVSNARLAAFFLVNADNMVDELGSVLAKYEVPMGMMNKLLMLSEFDSLEMIIDDSGSMQCQSDSIDKTTGRPHTRWSEAKSRLKEMIEVLAYVPFNQIGIEFLNRKERISLLRQGRDPQTFLADAYQQIETHFARGPSGTTPALEKLQDSFQRGQGASIARYFFGDGAPNVSLTKRCQPRPCVSLCAHPSFVFFCVAGRRNGGQEHH